MHTTEESNKKLFILAFLLTFIFAALEILYGFISGSLMIIGDGIHMSSDAVSLGLSLIAAILVTKGANQHYTFGYKRFEPIAAFINGLTLVLIPLFIIYEAIVRLINPIEILAKEMLIVGLIGLLINGIVGYVLSKASSNLNVRSAMLHVLADMFTSFSAVVAALGIMLFDWVWLDPVGSVITSLIIIRGGISITKEAFRILMEGTPDGYHVPSLIQIAEEHLAVRVLSCNVWCTNEQHVYALFDLEPSDDKPHTFDQEMLENMAQQLKIPKEHLYIR